VRCTARSCSPETTRSFSLRQQAMARLRAPKSLQPPSFVQQPALTASCGPVRRSPSQLTTANSSKNALSKDRTGLRRLPSAPQRHWRRCPRSAATASPPSCAIPVRRDRRATRHRGSDVRRMLLTRDLASKRLLRNRPCRRLRAAGRSPCQRALLRARIGKSRIPSLAANATRGLVAANDGICNPSAPHRMTAASPSMSIASCPLPATKPVRRPFKNALATSGCNVAVVATTRARQGASGWYVRQRLDRLQVQSTRARPTRSHSTHNSLPTPCG